MIRYGNIEFMHPQFFLLLILIPLLLLWYIWRFNRRYPEVRIPTLQAFTKGFSFRGTMRHVLTGLKLLAFCFLIIALARPRNVMKEENIKAEAIDIALVMDLSSSMLSRDFKPDRLEASKELAAEFVEKRPHDRIALAAFAAESYSQSPLTTDHNVIKEFLANLKCGILEDGTAIGMGLASGVNLLKESESKSKIIILLTDGVNRSGYINPRTAAEIAKKFDVKVYTIGVGSRGTTYGPYKKTHTGEYIFGRVQVNIDEQLLKDIAEITGGKYYRATDNERMSAIYDEINKLEKTEIEVTTVKRYSEAFRPWLRWAILLLLLDLILGHTLFRTIP